MGTFCTPFFMGHGFGIVGGFIQLLLLAGIIYLVIKVASGCIAASNRSKTGIDTPLDILQKRLAKGEISTEEYSRLRENLS